MMFLSRLLVDWILMIKVPIIYGSAEKLTLSLVFLGKIQSCPSFFTNNPICH